MIDSYKFIEIRELSGMSQGEFAKKLGLTRELVNKMESGKMRVSKRTAQRIREFMEQHGSTDYSQDVNILGRPSQVVRRQVVQPYHLARRDQKSEEAPLMVPLVPIKAVAGYIKGYEQVDYMDALEKYSLPPGVNPTGAVWRYFEIDGDSMEPTLSTGDVVLATMVPHEDWNDIRNFCVYVILKADQLLIKRLYRKSETEWVMISDNEEGYPQVLLNVEEVKQLWLFRRHIRARVPQPKEFKITA